MFQLTDIRKTRVWQEAREEGFMEGFAKGFEKGNALAELEIVPKCLANGMAVKEIAKLLDLSIAQVRRLAKIAEK